LPERKAKLGSLALKKRNRENGHLALITFICSDSDQVLIGKRGLSKDDGAVAQANLDTELH